MVKGLRSELWLGSIVAIEKGLIRNRFSRVSLAIYLRYFIVSFSLRT